MNKRITIVFLMLGLTSLLVPSCGKKDNKPSQPTSSEVESESEEEHKHKYSSDWTYDHKYHWHAAICGHDVVKDKAEHIFDEQEMEDGGDSYTKYTCSVCGYSYNDNEMYKIRWMSDEDTVIYSENYPVGAMPSYDYDTYGTPTKASENPAYRYEFSHWSPAIAVVTKAQTYIAQYDQVENKYHVTWKNYDGSVLHEHDVQAGQTPVYPYEDPTRPDDGYEATYSFEGWSPVPGPISEDTIYTAQFARHVISDALQFTEIEGGTAYEVSGYNETPSGSLTIPAMYHDKPVKSIGYRAFRNCTLIETVILPESVIKLDKYAFEGCSNLESFGGSKLANITSFGMGAFKGCSSFVLAGSDFPSNLTSIPQELFRGCRSLGTTIPYSLFRYVTTIGTSAFQNCSNIQYLDSFANTGVQSIGEDAFNGCTSLAWLPIPSGCNTIEPRAFYGCTSLESIRFNTNTTVAIGANAFEGCTSLSFFQTISSNSISSIGNYAFKGTNLSVVSLIVVSSLTSVGIYAFQNCASLTVFRLPTSVATIGKGALMGTPELTTLEVPFIGHSASDTNNQYLGYLFGAEKQADVVNANGDSEKLTTIKITGSSCTTIQPYAFYNIGKNTTNIMLPSSVTTIKAKGFVGCRAYELNLADETNYNNYRSIEAEALDVTLDSVSVPFIGTVPNTAADKDRTDISFSVIFDSRVYLDLRGTLTCYTKYYPSKSFNNEKIATIVIGNTFTEYLSADTFYGVKNCTEIRFNGKVSQFQTVVNKSNANWARGIPNTITKIVCTDGNYTI